jgi:hypothetical protein
MADIGLRIQVAAGPDLSVGVDAADFDIWLREQVAAAPQISCFPTQWGIRPAAQAGGHVELVGTATAGATASGDLKAGIDLAGAATASASSTGDLKVGVELQGGAAGGAAGDGQLDVGVGVGLTGDAMAGATGDGHLDIGIELAGDAVAGADAEATLSGGEGSPTEPEVASGGSPIILRPRRPRWKRNQDAVAALVATRWH